MSVKIKSAPEDFRVEELTDVQPGEQGEFAFYQLNKRGWNTADVLASIRQIWKIDWQRLEYGGLKDRHAVTTQYLTIYRGPKADLLHNTKGWEVKHLGFVHQPFQSQSIKANRFTIVIRNLHPWQITRAESAAGDIKECGVPNYFDDQRFGSVNPVKSGRPEFVAKEMVLGRFEEALKIALAGYYEFDRATDKKEKAVLLQHWGDWPTCKTVLQKGHARSLVDYLVHHPTDFRGACERLKPEMRGLYLSVYQSDLWNRMLSTWLSTNLTSADLTGIKLRLGTFAVPKKMPDDAKKDWLIGSLPYLSARLKPLDVEGQAWLPIAEKVLAEESLTLEQLKIKGMDKPFFSKGDRAMCLQPMNFEMESQPDDQNKNRMKLILRFELQSGSYATMIIKRLTATEPLKNNQNFSLL